MSVLLIATNQVTYPAAVPPLGAASVARAAQRAGHQVELLDLCFARSPRRLVQRALRRLRPEVVAFSVRNLDSCSYHYQEEYIAATRHLVSLVREELPEATLVAGGSAVTIGQADLLAALGLGLGIVGEGEGSFVALLAALGAGGGLDEVPGLISLEVGGSRANAPSRSLELDQLALNDLSPLRLAPYLRRGGQAGIQTKRGCAFRCLYCNYPAIEGSQYRLRSPGLVVDDLEAALAAQGVRDFFFTDSVFNFPTAQAAAICEEILRRKLRLRWMAYCNPRGLDRELARLFRAAGCVGVELGLDGATEKLLAVLDKGFGTAEIERTCAALSAAGLPFAVDLLFGGPGETWADVEEAHRFLSTLPKAAAVFANLGLRIYRDTRLFELAAREGLVARPADALRPRYYLSPELGPNAAARLDALAARTTTWITPTDWTSPLVRLVHTVKGRLGSHPTWKGFEEYGKHMRRGAVG